MFLTSEDPQKSLSELEQALDKGPQGQDAYLELLSVVTWLKGLESTQESEYDAEAVKLLGTAVGKQWNEKHAWQDPYRESGILAQVLLNLDHSTSAYILANQYLRVIGNSIAYNDTNREVVSHHFDTLVSCLGNSALARTALAVLYNYGQDFEPANVQAANARLDQTIAQYLASGKIPEEAIGFATTILSRTTDKLTEAQLKDDISSKVFDDILTISANYDEDHSQDYIAILVHYLQEPSFQQKVAKPDTVQKLFDLLLEFESNELTDDDVQNAMQELGTQEKSSETDSEETGIILTVRLVNTISALSASDIFVQNFTLDSPFVQVLKSKLALPKAMPSSVCACVILGNLATSDAVCINMVQKLGLHALLNGVLADRNEQALLYAAAGFMRHLTFPESNRPILAEAGLIDTCCHLLHSKDSAVRGEAAAMLCKLVTSCLPNIRRIVLGGIPQNLSILQLPELEPTAQPTILDHIIIEALAPSGPLPSTTMKNPMIELGRTLVAILRYIRRTSNEDDVADIAHAVFNTQAIARPLARLVRQRFYADARSEGLLGLGLMAQTEEGARCIVAEIKADDGLLEAIKEFAGEQKGDAPKSDENAGRDYQNALVLFHGLSSNGEDGMDATMKGSIEALQAELSKLMA